MIFFLIIVTVDAMTCVHDTCKGSQNMWCSWKVWLMQISILRLSKLFSKVHWLVLGKTPIEFQHDMSLLYLKWYICCVLAYCFTRIQEFHYALSEMLRNLLVYMCKISSNSDVAIGGQSSAPDSDKSIMIFPVRLVMCVRQKHIFFFFLISYRWCNGLCTWYM